MEIKYLENGQKVSYIGEAGGKHVIKYLYYDEDYEEEFESEKTELVSRVFDKAPVEVFDERVKAIQSQIDEFVRARMKARKELMEIKKEKEEFEKSYASHPQFRRLKNLLEGKINYLIDLREFRIEHIAHERYHHVARFSLDRVGGEFIWKLNDDGTDMDSYPCKSKEEALDVMKDYIRDRFVEDGSWALWYKEKLVKVAEKYGVEVPVEFVEKYRMKEVEEAKKELERLRGKVTEQEKKIESISAGEPVL